jgi:hypothetical protein
LATDPDTGDVAMSAADNAPLGTVGRWDGKTFTIDNQAFDL